MQLSQNCNNILKLITTTIHIISHREQKFPQKGVSSMDESKLKATIIELLNNKIDIDILDLIIKLLIHESNK